MRRLVALFGVPAGRVAFGILLGVCAVGFGVVTVLALVLVGGGRFGADGGGVVVFAVGFVVLRVLLAGLRGRAHLRLALGTEIVQRDHPALRIAPLMPHPALPVVHVGQHHVVA